MKKEQTYKQPDCRIINIAAQSVLCASGFNAPTPSNPFGESTEEPW